MEETVRLQINKLSLWQLLTIIDCQVISLTSVLVVGGHGAVSWDYDSDVLCTHRSVCSFVTNNGGVAEHWCVSLYSMLLFSFTDFKCGCFKVVKSIDSFSNTTYIFNT